MDSRTYVEKLRDPRWQRRRLEIFQRDNWTCQLCSRTDLELHVHHLYRTTKDPWDEPDLRLTVESLLKSFRLHRENELLVADLKRKNSELETERAQQLLPVGALAAQILGGVVLHDVAIVARIPLLVIDAVENADDGLGARGQSRLHTHASGVAVISRA